VDEDVVEAESKTQWWLSQSRNESILNCELIKTRGFIHTKIVLAKLKSLKCYRGIFSCISIASLWLWFAIKKLGKISSSALWFIVSLPSELQSHGSSSNIVHIDDDTMSVCLMIFRMTYILPMMVHLILNSPTTILPNVCLPYQPLNKRAFIANLT